MLLMSSIRIVVIEVVHSEEYIRATLSITTTTYEAKVVTCMNEGAAGRIE